MTQRELKDAPAAGRPRSAVDRLNALIVSSLGLGYAPVASGTFGTLGGVALALLFKLWLCPRLGWHFGITAAAVCIVLLLVGFALGGWAERYYRLKDPKPFVLDEVVGYLIAVLRWKPGTPGWQELLLAFIVFRAFDVLKPWPARRLEFLPRGYGIMLDDVVAGLYSLAVVWMIRDHNQWP